MLVHEIYVEKFHEKLHGLFHGGNGCGIAFVARELAPAGLRSSPKKAGRVTPEPTQWIDWGRFAA
ncbi:hypothetical protein, partial [Pseudomonas edaphica]|uniref:hypothetical protein n=1 Tax=Pseudomonas edaphica TaxID=2006980 RepID=UPI0019805F48